MCIWPCHVLMSELFHMSVQLRSGVTLKSSDLGTVLRFASQSLRPLPAKSKSSRSRSAGGSLATAGSASIAWGDIQTSLAQQYNANQPGSWSGLYTMRHSQGRLLLGSENRHCGSGGKSQDEDFDNVHIMKVQCVNYMRYKVICLHPLRCSDGLK